MAKKSTTNDGFIETIEPTIDQPVAKAEEITAPAFEVLIHQYDETIRICQEKIWAGVEVGKSNQTLKDIGAYCMALRRWDSQGGNMPEKPIL